MKTKVTINSPKSTSLKSTIPEGIVTALKISQGDFIEWDMEVRDGKIIAVVKKT